MRVSRQTGPARGDWLRQNQVLQKAMAALFVAVALVVVLFVVVLLVQPRLLLKATAQIDRLLAPALFRYDRELSDRWAIESGEMLREVTGDFVDLPDLYIDVPFKEISKIYAKREEALERGILVQGGDDFVKGSIRYEDRSLPIKLRLKGDWNDHLMGRKWSFRIRVRKGDQLFGMRRFSVQNPNTRGFQSEMLYFEALRMFGVMVPRYRFANVTLNGDSMGLMAIEEFFAKELLEYNQRKEGVIIRFDESFCQHSREKAASLF